MKRRRARTEWRTVKMRPRRVKVKQRRAEIKPFRAQMKHRNEPKCGNETEKSKIREEKRNREDGGKGTVKKDEMSKKKLHRRAKMKVRTVKMDEIKLNTEEAKKKKRTGADMEHRSEKK